MYPTIYAFAADEGVRMERLLLLLFLALSPFAGKSQSLDEVRNSGKYYFGTGEGSNYNMARRDALESLTNSISVQVQSKFEEVIKETESDFSSYVNSVVNTYSTAVVSRYSERVLKEDRSGVEVLVYIERENMEDIFTQRVSLIHNFIRNAMRAEGELRIADALRYYYWALILARSHPDNTRLRYAFDGKQEDAVMLGLYDRINNVFSFLDIRVAQASVNPNAQRKELYLDMRYKGELVQDLDYIYWLGDGYSSLVSARNGQGTAALEGELARNATQLRIQIEYRYAHKARLEPEVQLMLESVDIPYFPRAELTVPLEAGATSGDTRKQVEKVLDGLDKPAAAPAAAGAKDFDFKKPLESILEAVHRGSLESVRAQFSTEGYALFKRMMAEAQVKVLPPRSEELKLWKIHDKTLVRSFPMSFAYQNNRVEFVEDVVFTFDAQGKVCNVSHSLGDVAIRDIMNRPEGFGSAEDRHFLISFMEDYKTAYALKRHDYLEAIFDDQALIIVGNVVRRDASALDQRGFYSGLSQKDVEYIQLSKGEYMDRLGRIFDRNEFINIRFEDNQVRKTQKDEKIYGIQIAQHYYSSTYADKGHLFLMIDLTDTLNPRVYVRTWQPEKNADGSIFGLEDFRF